MRNVTLSDTQLAAYSGEHLLYEIQFFQFTAKELANQTKPSPVVSVLIESFGIHFRNLVDFFYTAAGSEKNDDVIAADFCPGWNENPSSTLKDARERVNKELSHLTLKRKSGLDPTKPWDIAGLFAEISQVARKFVAQASAAKLSPDVRNWVNSYYPNLMTVGPIAMTTNTTANIAVLSTAIVP